MEKTPSQRIIDYLKSKQTTKKLVIKATGVSRQSVDYWFKGRNEITDKNIQKIIDVLPELNEDWVWTGRGEPQNTKEYVNLDDADDSVLSDRDLIRIIKTMTQTLEYLKDRNKVLEDQMEQFIKGSNKKNKAV